MMSKFLDTLIGILACVFTAGLFGGVAISTAINYTVGNTIASIGFCGIVVVVVLILIKEMKIGR